MKVHAELLPAAEVALLLRARLGTLRAWADFLADCIRNRQHLSGLQLLPHSSLHTDSTTIGRPLYRREDVETFIGEARLVAGVTGSAFGLEPITVIVDDTPGVPWGMRRAKRITAGGPAGTTSAARTTSLATTRRTRTATIATTSP